MNEKRTVSGKWVVLGVIALGVIAGVVGVVFRQFPEDWGREAAPAATTQAGGENAR